MIQNLFAVFFFFTLSNSHVNSLGSEGIVGGYHAPNDTFKYVVTLNNRKLTSFGIINVIQCTGALVGKRHVVTIGSCITKQYPNGIALVGWYRIAMGTRDFRLKNALVIEIEEIYIPEEYDPVTHVADLAVVKLKKELNFDDHPQLETIALPDESTIDENILRANVSGYGCHKYNIKSGVGKTNYELKYLNVNVTSIKECKSISAYPSHSLLCVRSMPDLPEQQWGICTNEIGAPLVYDGKLIGLANSAQRDCVDTIKPTLYTRIKPYVNFIRSIIEDKPPLGTRHWRNPYDV